MIAGKPSMPLLKGYSRISPKRFREAQELGRGQRQLAEEKHAVLEPGAADAGDGGVADLGAEIDAMDLGADGPGNRPRLNQVGWHRRALLLAMENPLAQPLRSNSPVKLPGQVPWPNSLAEFPRP